MLDRCPHRSAKLSVGILVDACKVRCAYHGFEFAQDGSCLLVPETAREAPNLSVKSFPVREEHGFLWLWWGEAVPLPAVPWFDQLSAGFSYSSAHYDWTAHITRCIENQLDYAHLPFVHHNTIGRGLDPRAEMVVESTADSIGFYKKGDSNQSAAQIEFRFPNIWTLTIVPHKFSQMLAFVPIDEQTTRLYLRAYQKYCTVPGLAALVNSIMRITNGVILSQDRRVVLSQWPQNSLEAGDEKLYPSDRAISLFRQKWQGLQG